MIKSIKWLLIAMIMAFLLFIARNFLHKDSSLPKQHIPIIGVIQAIDHCALDQTRQGILDELKTMVSNLLQPCNGFMSLLKGTLFL